MVSVRGHYRGGRWVSAHTRRGGAAGGGVLLGAAAAVLWWNAGHPSVLPSQQTKGVSVAAVMTRVVDGDTIIVRDRSGKDLGRVRILGMDAPELAHDGQLEMCGAKAARDELVRLLERGEVDLLTDPQQPNADRYGRLLRYVEVDSTDVSESLIRSGHAPNTSRARSHTRHKDYAAAEDEAQQQKRGLWGTCL